jgi:hypothetical protein
VSSARVAGCLVVLMALHSCCDERLPWKLMEKLGSPGDVFSLDDMCHIVVICLSSSHVVTVFVRPKLSKQTVFFLINKNNKYFILLKKLRRLSQKVTGIIIYSTNI